jgi:tRNA(Ile)-lysidine synthase
VLNIPALLNLTKARQRNVLRYWMQLSGASLPSTNVLQHLMLDVLHARQDAQPCVSWGDVEARRYRDQLFLVRKVDPLPAKFSKSWDLKHKLVIPGMGTLTKQELCGSGLKQSLLEDKSLRVRVRQGGERVRPSGRGHERELKKLLQEKGVPPWERGRIPVLYLEGKIVAIPGVCVCEGFQASKDEPGCEILWQPERLSIEH